MSLLTSTLVPPEMLDEDDSLWDFDSLLQSVTQDFNAEKRLTFNEDDRTGAGSTPQGGSSRSSRALVA
ncbi:unnamed protein product [Hapterophycus canaliculatus]